MTTGRESGKKWTRVFRGGLVPQGILPGLVFSALRCVGPLAIAARGGVIVSAGIAQIFGLAKEDAAHPGQKAAEHDALSSGGIVAP